MKDVLIVDFDDSFIHNICESVDKLGLTYQLVHHLNVQDDQLKYFKTVLLGPGPGHISEYKHIEDIIIKNKEVSNFVGICLGHQMLGVILGLELVQLKFPYHGKSLDLEKVGKILNLKDLKGQFYNSWALMNKNNSLSLTIIEEHDMVVYFKYKNFKGVQFHPESVGTNFSRNVFELLLGSR